MQRQRAEFAIIGAGPAGAHLASRLAAGNRRVLLFDPKGAWEKPCGGGVPSRALREFSFILDNTAYPRKLIRRVTLVSASGRRLNVNVKRPFAIFSRQVLNRLVLDRAVAAGAEFAQTGVTEFTRDGDGWRLTTADGRAWQARFLIGADGAASPTRRKLVGIFPKQDLALAFGYNVNLAHATLPSPDAASTDAKDAGETAVIYFPPDFTGYIWAFPRPGVMNFGIAAKLGEKTSEQLRALLGDFVRQFYGGAMPAEASLNFFGAKIPTLDAASWQGLQTTGDGWALIGDAAGFTDPITGEGIYYALRSAELLAEVLLQEDGLATSQDAGAQYERRWREFFGRELERASHQLPRFYHGRFFGAPFVNAVIFLAAHHRGVRDVLVNALTGEQNYTTLRRDLLSSAHQVF